MGVFKVIFQALSMVADFKSISIDATSCKYIKRPMVEKNRGVYAPWQRGTSFLTFVQITAVSILLK